MPANNYKNFATGTLLAAITTSSTSCTLQSGQGGNFPTGDGTTDMFKVVIVKSTGEREICVCKRTAGSDVITFIDVSDGSASVAGRAQEGTTALAFAAGDRVENRLTASQIESFEDDIDSLQTTVTTINGDYLTSSHHGAGSTDHDDRYYSEAEIDAFFEGEAASKKQVDQDRITNRSLPTDGTTKMWFYQDAAPTAWTLIANATDRLLGVRDDDDSEYYDTGGTTVGSAWTAGNHTHTMGTHSHGAGSYNASGDPADVGPFDLGIGAAGYNFASENHTHDVSGTSGNTDPGDTNAADAYDSTFRPKTCVGIMCTLDAL